MSPTTTERTARIDVAITNVANPTVQGSGANQRKATNNPAAKTTKLTTEPEPTAVKKRLAKSNCHFWSATPT